MFPIANEYGKIVGFGGRVLDNSNPKYINSPESVFLKKEIFIIFITLNRNKIKKKC